MDFEFATLSPSSVDTLAPGASMGDYFLGVIATGLAVPGLTGALANASQKREWLQADPREFYRQYPNVATYLEHHRNHKGASMTLDKRPYLLSILTDNAREIVVQKCVQCGITEIALCRAYHNGSAGLSVLYVLPSHPVRNRLVNNRVDKHLRMSPYYRAQVRTASVALGRRASDGVGMKQIGLGVIHFVGSNTEGEFSEFPADDLIIDEQDLCDPDNLTLARDRLSESEYKRILRISNPRKPGAPHSIGNVFSRSDQKHWEVQCSHCGKYQELDWHEHFILKVKGGGYKLRNALGHGQGDPVCKHCNKSFDRLGPGRWTARNPGASISGYQLSKLYLASCDIADLFKVFLEASNNESKLQAFYGSELGMYYIPKSAALTLDDLTACVGKDLLDWPDMAEVNKDKRKSTRPVVMGVDVGAVLHYKASYLDPDGKRVSIGIGTVSTFGDLEAEVKRLGVHCLVIDAHPELHKVHEFASESKAQVWACIFGSPEMVTPYRTNWEEQVPTVVANRTAVMDASYADIKNGIVILPEAVHMVPDFFTQMQGPKRQWDAAAAKGAGRFIWTKPADGNDHYRLADTYEYLAAQVYADTGAHVTRL